MCELVNKENNEQDGHFDPKPYCPAYQMYPTMTISS